MEIMSTATPNRNDVLFGRGNYINGHAGNIRYRALVESYKPKFLQLKKNKDKQAMAAEIVDEIRSSDPPGRFLMLANADTQQIATPPATTPDDEGVHPAILNRVWVFVDAGKVRMKVLHRLREKPPNKEGGNEGKQEGSAHNLSESFADTNSRRKRLVSVAKQNELNEKDLEGQPSEAHPDTGSIERVVSPLESNRLHASWDLDFDKQIDELEKLDELEVSYDLLPEAAGDRSLAPSIDINLDQEVSTFLHQFSHQNEDHVNEELSETTLRQWIETRKIRSQDPSAVYRHIQTSVLPVALKLTDFLLEAEKEELDGHMNPVPLESIDLDKVLVYSKGPAASLGGVAGGNIEYVTIMSSIGDSPKTGTVSERLYALGIIFYELLSCCNPHRLENDMQGEIHTTSASQSLSSINLGQDSSEKQTRTKLFRYQGHTLQSKRIANLECMGVPKSACNLIRDLLDTQSGDFLSDLAFRSFEDVRVDIDLMLNDPARFLSNVATNPMPLLVVPDKLYGREAEIDKLEAAYNKASGGNCGGVIIAGKAGVGKTRLAMHTMSLGESYFLTAKFDQNKDSMPLWTVGRIFNSLCEVFFQDASHSQLKAVGEQLNESLGSQASLIAGIVPSLAKLMPSFNQLSVHNLDFAENSMRFLMSQLLIVISSNTNRRVSLLFDDIQWSDPASLLLMGEIVSSLESQGNQNVYFIFCYRDDEVDGNVQFHQWLDSMPETTLDTVKVGNLSVAGVNSLVSDTMQLSPRITRPLSTILHQKSAGGNTLFLLQVMATLKEQGYINFDLGKCQWQWDMDKIMDMKVSDDVVALLIVELQKLTSDQQKALMVASCVGASVKFIILDILSDEFKLNLPTTLQQLVEKGLLEKVNDKSFRFSHDKIQQSAHELMSDALKRETHMRIGLALCTNTMEGALGDWGAEELFFTAVSQMNKGGPSALHNPIQKEIIAKLNVKAGKKAMALSDYNSSFILFNHGIEFLNSECWASQYDLSVELYDLATETACLINNREAVTSYSDILIKNAKTFDDKLNCLHAVAKSLRHHELLKESLETTLDIFKQLGEKPPRRTDDPELVKDMEAMNNILENTSDETLRTMAKMNNQKVDTLMKIYENLDTVVLFFNPSLQASGSLRMMQLTLKFGLSPLVGATFAHYGQALISTGEKRKVALAQRLGRLALTFLDDPSINKAKIICYVYYPIMWASMQMQVIVDAILLGHKAGQQSGDFFHATLDYGLSMLASLVSGNSIDSILATSREFITSMQSGNNSFVVGNIALIHTMALCLKEGQHMSGYSLTDIPEHWKNKIYKANEKTYELMRTFFLCRDEIIELNFLEEKIKKEKHQIRPLAIEALFFEGLLCFHYARCTNESLRWMAQGEEILVRMEEWSGFCKWNFENRFLLLKAEKMFSLKRFVEAEPLYLDSIQSSRDHKFIHGEAAASELAGLFFHKTERLEKSRELLLHSKKCYEKWGATAVAKRIDTLVSLKFGSDFLDPTHDVLQRFFTEDGESSTNKRKGPDSERA